MVGRAALKGILQHPRLELVGLRVYSEEKEGMDAGELIGLPACGVADELPEPHPAHPVEQLDGGDGLPGARRNAQTADNEDHPHQKKS